MTRPFNFSAGPAVLPEPVLRATQAAIWDLNGSGIGILEHSHRGTEFARVHARTEQLIREVGGIGDEYAIVFVTAGATHHFAMIPENFLGANETADYLDSGVWSSKAITEARRYGSVHVASTTAPDYKATPDKPTYSASPRYVHYTSNETIYGTQWASPPRAPAPLVCDASSDIFSRPLPLANHALIYAGAQKNLGPSGISLVIMRKDFVETGSKDLPPLAQYRTYVKENSLHNTPNTFGIFVIGEVMAWIKGEGGLAAMGERSAAKAKVLYDFLDASKVWKGHAEPASRSTMNVTFRATKELEEKAITVGEARGLSGLRGHRSVGGLRASIYNAFPADGVHALVKLLDDVEHGR
ncbi:MAG TPA: 3-phosphoserine/phosphohydroxythreonine transaminase [Kofleriaceae bacterium]|jgi:phosphoserine aminotransferase